MACTLSIQMPMLFCLRLHQTGIKPFQDGNLEPLYTACEDACDVRYGAANGFHFSLTEKLLHIFPDFTETIFSARKNLVSRFLTNKLSSELFFFTDIIPTITSFLKSFFASILLFLAQIWTKCGNQTFRALGQDLKKTD
jgi:hypothetical protein